MVPSALVLGVGNVGAGIVEALDEAGYDITAVDPTDTLKPECLSRVGGANAFHKQRHQDLSGDELARWLAAADEVVFCCDCGNRDTYVYTEQPDLGGRNIADFETFLRRVVALAGSSAAINLADLHISYVGGSWTRRQPDAGLTVTDTSVAKTAEASNPYERAKTAAHDAARRLSRELGLAVTFFDWISVLPNFAPNFSIAKMVTAGAKTGSITFSPGDFGRPVLHRKDAGRVLVQWCQAGRSKASRGVFAVVLVPGAFTPFQRFADTVLATLKQAGTATTLTPQVRSPELTCFLLSLSLCRALPPSLSHTHTVPSLPSSPLFLGGRF